MKQITIFEHTKKYFQGVLAEGLDFIWTDPSAKVWKMDWVVQIKV